MRIKRGMTFKSITNGKLIKVIRKASGSGTYWMCAQMDGGKKSHKIPEITLAKSFVAV